MSAGHAGARIGRHTIFLLAGIAALGSLATQLLVPALPTMAHELKTGIAEAQLVVGVFLIGLGAGQLATGALADRIGRRPVMLGGLAVYALASVAAAFAPSLPLLLAARVAQSLGAAAGVLTARVLVGDLYEPSEAVGKQATLMAVVLVSPALAPVIGGMMTEWLGWRAMFGVLAAAGLAGAIASATLLPVTGRRTARAAGTGFVEGYRRLFHNRAFLASMLAIAGASAGLHMFLGAAPFLLAHAHGLSLREIGSCLMLVALTSIGGTFLVARIERHADALVAGTGIAFIGSVALLALSLAGFDSLWAFLAPMTLLGLGAGLTGPSGISHVMRAEKGLEATAASVSGALQMLASAAAAYALLSFAEIDARHTGAGLLLATGLALAAALWRQRVGTNQ